MIYTVISDINEFKSARESAEKRDCHSWQPLTLIPSELRSYIENSGSDEVRIERLAAYSTLFFTLNKLYGEKCFGIARTPDGKPYLTEDGRSSDIRISISHSDGLVAVSISDEYEIGVDIQSEIEPARAQRLEKRFFSNINIKEDAFSQELLYLDFSGASLDLKKVEISDNDLDEFTKKWAFCESNMKCDGRGFGGIEKIAEIQKSTKTQVIKIKENSKCFALSTTIKVP